ncbi:ketopantoate reductase family protein [Catenibacterium sp.]|uniref:ketopantoate reductase family protein n=1 Tax=Catenibacterium sp. TaxID=2049022 RepID=UPI0039997DCB
MRILIYGAGVIGSLYAVLLKEAGYDTTIYARGHRLEALQNQGLLYKKNNIIKKVDIKVIDYLQDNDIYDFIFLTVRENQLYQALKELKSNKSKNIITMVNSIDTYEKWESIVGKEEYCQLFRELEAVSQMIYLMHHLLQDLYSRLLFLK